MCSIGSYIKELESYFHNIVGGGIMLSAKDMELLLNWKQDGISKEVVIRGISKAVEKHLSERGGKPPESLTYCARSVEEEYRKHVSSSSAPKQAAPNQIAQEQINQGQAAQNSESADLFEEVNQRLSKLIMEEERPELVEIYTHAREHLLPLKDINDSELFTRIEELQEAIFQKFFSTFEKPVQNELKDNAREMILNQGRDMTDESYQESLTFHINNILEKRFNIKNILSD